MARAHLTVATVRNLQFVGGGTHITWCIYWDRRIHGLGLRVPAANARSFVVRYRVRGNRAQRLKTIGDTATFTLDQARERAKVVIRSAELGTDWFDSVESSSQMTVRDLWDCYDSHHLKASAVSQRMAGEAPLSWTKHCAPRFANRRLDSITSEQARDWHRQLTTSGSYAANRAAQLMRAVWNYGVKFGQVPGELRNPFRAITPNREIARRVIRVPRICRLLRRPWTPWTTRS